ncbi:MAG: site-specific DNA-methyltransferase [Paludibacteraceae bacterium]|nr:site-specific DNA-methyltransferase [Paludibacteraceae bacterium]
MKNNTIINTDALVALRQLPNESIDCVVTDCPYLIAHRSTIEPTLGGILQGGGGNQRKEAVRSGKMFEHNDIKFSEWLPEVYRVLKKGTHCYIMINSRNIKELQQEAEKAGFVFQNLLVWNKSNSGGTPNKYYMQKCEFILLLSKRPARNINDMGTPNLLSVPNIIGKGEGHHPTEKPIELLKIMIRNSTNVGDIVLDPFAGSGSTLVAAKQLERQYIGYEIDEKYYKLALHNLQNTPAQTTLFDL